MHVWILKKVDIDYRMLKEYWIWWANLTSQTVLWSFNINFFFNIHIYVHDLSNCISIWFVIICKKKWLCFQFANLNSDNMSFWEWKYDISQYDICHYPNKIYANSIFFGYLNLKLVIFHLYLYERFRGYSSSLFLTDL